MRIAVYRTDGKFLFGDKLLDAYVNKEDIDIIDSYGIWFLIKRVENNKFLIASRFDNVRATLRDRLGRCIAVAICEGYSIYELYKEFLKSFKNLLELNGWIWDERFEEPTITRFNEFEIYGDEVEGVLTNYPSIPERLEMVRFAEKRLNTYSCVLYSKAKPKKFEKCFWIASQKIEKDKVDILFENLISAIENDDRKSIVEMSNNRNFVKLLGMLYKYDKRILKKMFKRYLDVILNHTEMYPESRSEIRKLGESIGVRDLIYKLEKVFGIERDTVAIPRPSESRFNIKLFSIVVTVIIAFAIILYFVYPMVFSRSLVDVEILTTADNRYSILLNSTNPKSNIPVLVAIFNETSVVKVYNVTLSSNKTTEILNWTPSGQGKYYLSVSTFGEQIYYKDITIANRTSPPDSLGFFRSVFKFFNFSINF